MIVNVKKSERVYNGFLKIDKAKVQFELFDGSTSQYVDRENCYRGNSVAILLFDPKLKNILLIKQFRYPAFCADKQHAWLLELPAGSIDKNEQPLNAVKRELLEETKLIIDDSKIKCIFTVFPSPGGTSEKIYIFTASADLSHVPENGGVFHEAEDIQSVLLPFDMAFNMLDENKIKDAKTVIALQWLKMNI